MPPSLSLRKEEEGGGTWHGGGRAGKQAVDKREDRERDWFSLLCLCHVSLILRIATTEKPLYFLIYLMHAMPCFLYHTIFLEENTLAPLLLSLPYITENMSPLHATALCLLFSGEGTSDNGGGWMFWKRQCAVPAPPENYLPACLYLLLTPLKHVTCCCCLLALLLLPTVSSFYMLKKNFTKSHNLKSHACMKTCTIYTEPYLLTCYTGGCSLNSNLP